MKSIRRAEEAATSTSGTRRIQLGAVEITGLDAVGL